MINSSTDISQRKAARVAGSGYLIVFLAALLAQFFVLQRLIVRGDAAATANAILANELLFRIGIAGWLIVLLCDVVVAWALYVFLKPVNKSLSLLAAWFRLIYTTIHGSAMLYLLFALVLLSSADYLTVFETDQLYALALLLLNGRNYGFLIGLVFFGLHLLILGYLVFKSGYIPRILGVLLLIAASGYLVDSFANILLSNYTDYEALFLPLVAIPSVIAELGLCLWLLLKGSKVQIKG